jgi:hypothetical protein
MNNINKKACLWILVTLSIAIYIVCCNFNSSNSNGIKEIFSIISKIITIDSLFILIFSKYFWKYKIFKNWLILIPDLSGTWKGYIYSTWEDPLTGQKPDRIPVILTINQSLFNISCVMRTYEMKSHSFLCNFIIDSENQVRRLAYMYDSIPKQNVKDRSPQHFGSAVYDLIENDTKLFGEYWTGRKTTGSIELDFWTIEKKDTIPEDLGGHPVSSARNNSK